MSRRHPGGDPLTAHANRSPGGRRGRSRRTRPRSSP